MSIRLRRQGPVIAAAIALFALAPPSGIAASAGSRAATPVEHVGALAPGDELFWDGPYIEQAGVPLPVKMPPLPCGIATCFEYTIDVAGAGERLRVALDQPRGQILDLELYDPTGTRAAHHAFACGCYSSELFAAQPVAGRWFVRVIASNVSKSTFRMRAKLEKAPKPKKKPVLLLPDLRPTPPFQLTFDPNADQSDRDGCQLSEIAPPPIGYAATRCLRFSTGPENIGDAPLDLFVRAGDAGRLTGPMYQRVYYSDGRPPEDRRAGEFEWHDVHRHYHHAGFGRLELFKVIDPLSGALVPAGEGPKQGFCMVDALIARWYEFDQDPAREVDDVDLGGCDLGGVGLQPPTGTHMGLTRGWGDVYIWSVEGNYVEFGANQDGLYVVRVISDPERTMHETNVRNNVSYAYIKVSGNGIEVLERGYGISPWDPRKVISNDIRPPTR